LGARKELTKHPEGGPEAIEAMEALVQRQTDIFFDRLGGTGR